MERRKNWYRTRNASPSWRTRRPWLNIAVAANLTKSSSVPLSTKLKASAWGVGLSGTALALKAVLVALLAPELDFISVWPDVVACAFLAVAASAAILVRFAPCVAVTHAVLQTYEVIPLRQPRARTAEGFEYAVVSGERFETCAAEAT